MNPWIRYNEAILAILAVVKQTVKLNDVQRRRIDEAKELVEAAIDIISIEEEADPDEYDDDEDEDDETQDYIQ